MPTTKRASSIKSKELARAVSKLPMVKTAIPKRRVAFRPKTSPSFPRIGAQAAVDMACASAVQVVLL